MEPLSEPKEQVATAWKNWKCFTIKIKPNELPILNQRLKIYGFNTTTELVKDFIAGKFPVITEDRQIQAYDSNLQANGLKTAVINGPFDPSFYKNTDLEDMLNYLLNIKRLQEHNARSLVSYFRRFRDTFFGQDPTQISMLTPHKRRWILGGMREFGNYYNYKTGNPECKELIEKTISRFALNVGLDAQHRIYIVDDNFVAEKIKLLMTIQGDIGLTVKVGLLTGLREDELIYTYSAEICSNQGGCNCPKLHVVSKPNGLTVVVVNWFRAHKKCYFTIMPTGVWTRFRALTSFNDSDIDIAHKMTKKVAEIKFVDLRKINYNVMCRVMEMHEADVLVGRAKSVAAKHYAIYELDNMVERYKQAWQDFGFGS